MGIQLRILVIIASISTILAIIHMIKKEKLELKYSLLWLLATSVIMIMAIVPLSIDYLAKILNIATPMNALFFAGICFILLILFSLTVAQSRNSKKVKDMAQKIALLEYELCSKNKEHKR